MKKIKIIAASLLAAAAAALLAPAARAQSPVTYNQGDLLIGFESYDNGVLGANNYVIDLGPATYFIGLSETSGTTNLTLNDPAHDGSSQVGLGNIVNDLSSSSGFGSTWASGTSTNLVQWGVFGSGSKLSTSVSTTGLPEDTLLETIAESTPGAGSNAPTEYSHSNQSEEVGNLASFAPDGAGYGGITATGTATPYSVFEASNLTENNTVVSWSGQAPSTNAFGIGNGIEQNGIDNGPTNSELDLYELIPTDKGGTGTGTLLGSFELTSGGTLDFISAAAVPEPSTYAAIGIGAAFLLVFRRTRKSSQV